MMPFSASTSANYCGSDHAHISFDGRLRLSANTVPIPHAKDYIENCLNYPEFLQLIFGFLGNNLCIHSYGGSETSEII